MTLPEYVISDTHFFHDNIVKLCDRPYDHDHRMAKRWREYILDGTTVLHLGDVLMGKRELWPYLSLPGNVEVLIGNHDETHKRSFMELKWGWRFRGPYSVVYRDHMIYFTHEPMDLEEVGRTGINVHGHIHNQPDPSPQHINVSVERTNYAPVLLKDLLDQRIKELDS